MSCATIRSTVANGRFRSPGAGGARDGCLGSGSRLRLFGALCIAWLATTAFGARPVLGAEGASSEGGVATPIGGSEAIAEITVQGLRRVGREAALSTTKLRPGARFSGDALTADLRAIWKTGFFRDVQVYRQVVPEGLRIVYRVEEKPSIKEVTVEGSDDVSEEDIKGVIDVKPFTILNVDHIKRNVTKIKDLYVEKGHYLAEVSFRVDPVKGNSDEVVVVFVVVENAKVMVRQISFIGNHHLDADLLKSVLQTREGGELSWLSQSGTYKEEFFQTDLFRIQALYYDHGFVSIKVGEPTATLSKDRRHIYLTVPIEEGEQYEIGKITFAGDVDLAATDDREAVSADSLREKLTVRPDELFNRTKLFADIQTLTDVYRDRGYAYANVTPNSRIRAEDKRVDLELEVERGDIVHFGRIQVVGNTRTRDKVIRRELRVYEGDKYSASGVNLSKARVYQLGYFETVNISTSRGTRPDQVNVTVEVKEKSTGTFQVGVGFSSVESFIATAQISQNNFLGNGQLLSISAQLSFGDFARQLATLEFYEPYFLDTMWSFGLNAYITQRLYRDFQRNASGVSPSFGYPITHALRVRAGYTLQRIEISTDLGSSSFGPSLYNLNRDGWQSSVNGSVSYDTRDNRLFPSSGHFHVVRGEISDPRLGSEQGLAFKRVEVDLRYYYPLPLSLVAKLNVSLGWVFGGGEHGVPISERFFPGGIYSVRGFEPRGLGPTVPVGNKGDPGSGTYDFTIGGNKQAVFNLELEFPIIKQAGIKGVIFADAGNAYNDDEEFFHWNTDPANRPKAYLMDSDREITPPLGLYYSFGFGFRWFSPIGPLRFEWGIPITKREATDRCLIFEFTIGNFF